jgi:hypothetical protein
MPFHNSFAGLETDEEQLPHSAERVVLKQEGEEDESTLEDASVDECASRDVRTAKSSRMCKKAKKPKSCIKTQNDNRTIRKAKKVTFEASSDAEVVASKEKEGTVDGTQFSKVISKSNDGTNVIELCSLR